MNMIKILIADNSHEFGEKSAAELMNFGFAVSTTTKNGRILLDAVKNLHPDVVMMDISMQGIDALEVIKRISDFDIIRPKIIVTSFGDCPFWEKCLYEAGADMFLLLPFESEVLASRIRRMTAGENKPAESFPDIEKSVTEELRKLAISPHMKGYDYIREGVLMCLDDKNMLDDITKTLYPQIAKKFNSSKICVERSIATALDHAWKKWGDISLQEVCGMPETLKNSRPQNGRFLSIFVEAFSSRYGLDNELTLY